MDKQRERTAALERELKKAQEWMTRSKNVKDLQTLQAENRNLRGLLEQSAREHKEQQSALRKNMKTIYESNAELTEQLEQYKEREKQLSQREDECKLAEERLRVQQLDLANKLQQEAHAALQEQRSQLEARMEDVRRREEELKGKEEKIKQHFLHSLVGPAKSSTREDPLASSSGDQLWDDDSPPLTVGGKKDEKGTQPPQAPSAGESDAKFTTSTEGETASSQGEDALTPSSRESQTIGDGEQEKGEEEQETLQGVHADREVSASQLSSPAERQEEEKQEKGRQEEEKGQQEEDNGQQHTTTSAEDLPAGDEEDSPSLSGLPANNDDKPSIPVAAKPDDAALTESVADLKKQLDEARKQLQYLNTQLLVWQEKTKVKQTNCMSLQEEMKELVQTHTTQIERFTKEKDDALQVQGQLRSTLDSLKRELDELRQQAAALEHEKKRMEEELQSEKERLSKEKSEVLSTEVSRLESELKSLNAERKREMEVASKERKEEVEQWRVRLEQERGHWKEELSLIQEDRGIMINKLTEKDLALDELREELALQQSNAQQQIQGLKRSLAAESAKVAEVLKDKAESLNRLRERSKEELTAAQATHQKLVEEMKTLKDEVLAKVKALEAARTASAKLQEQLHEQQALVAQKDKHADALAAQLKTLQDSLAASHKQSNHLNESLEKATEERLDAEKALQALQAEKEEQEQRARRDIEGLQNLVASLEKQNAELEGNLISQADAFRQERSELDAAKAALHRDLEARGAALTELQAQHSGLISAHAELQTSNQTLSAQLEHLKEHEAESKSKLEEELSKVIAAKEALEENLRTLHQRFDDAELERKIAERKTQQMIKELKNQLAKERAKLQKGAGTITPSPSPLPSPASSPRLHVDERNNGSDLGTPNSRVRRDLALSSPSVADDGGGQRVKAEWQKRCELLEQQMAALQQEKEQLAAKLHEKSEIIQRYLFTLKREGRATPLMEKDKAMRASKGEGIMSSLFRASSGNRERSLAEEMTTTMSTLLEDTLLKNIQLKTDIETLGNEVARLTAENERLRRYSSTASSAASSPPSSLSVSPRESMEGT